MTEQGTGNSSNSVTLTLPSTGLYPVKLFPAVEPLSLHKLNRVCNPVLSFNCICSLTCLK